VRALRVSARALIEVTCLDACAMRLSDSHADFRNVPAVWVSASTVTVAAGSLEAVHCLDARASSWTGWEAVLVGVQILEKRGRMFRGCDVVRVAVSCLVA